MQEAEAPVGVGQRLGKYVITEKLGEGGMGIVFAGVHEGLGREVAIKLLLSQLAKNAQMISRFQAEAEAVSRIGHNNIVAVYDFGRLADGSMYYVMERIHGETLTQRLDRGALSRDEVVSVFGQICRALQATHARQIVHRDLKPDNVILQTQRHGAPVVKILDFGIAKMRGDDGKHLTAVGTLMGTPAFMAPEQITACHLVDGRADLYSLGAMLYQVFTGEPPFLGEPMVVLTKTISEQPVPPRQRATWMPPALDAMVMRALSKDLSHRQPDAATFLAELEAAWPPEPKPATIAPPVSPSQKLPIAVASGQSPSQKVPAPSSAPSKLWMMLGGAGVLMLVAALAIVAMKRRDKPVTPPVEISTADARRALVDALDGDVVHRRLAIEAIAEARDSSKGGIDLLVRALGDGNPEVRRAAAYAAGIVGKSGDDSLAAALGDAGSRSGGAVAVEINVARLRLGANPAVDELKRVVESRAVDGATRLSAAVALAEMNKLGAKPLRSAMAAAPSARRSLKWRAQVALFQMGDDAQFAGELEKAMKGTDAAARLDAAQTMARVGDGDAKAALAELAQGAPDAADRVEARAILAELGDAAQLAPLLEALGAPQPNARARAAAALGRLAEKLPDRRAAAARLTPLLRDSDDAPRLAAAAALQAIAAIP